MYSYAKEVAKDPALYTEPVSPLLKVPGNGRNIYWDSFLGRHVVTRAGDPAWRGYGDAL